MDGLWVYGIAIPTLCVHVLYRRWLQSPAPVDRSDPLKAAAKWLDGGTPARILTPRMKNERKN